MKTELENVSAVHKELKIEIEPAEIKPVYDKVIQQYSKLASVPGFRKGFAPRDVIKNRFREDIMNDVLRELLPERVQQAIQENELQPLSEPQLHIDDSENIQINGTQPISLHVHVEVMPEIETVNYKGLSAVRRVRPLNEEEIERIIDERRKEYANFEPIEDRAAEIGDTVNVDVRGRFLDDEAAEPIEVDDLQIELGGAGVQKEFTENLVGLKPDEEKTFTVSYPTDFTSQGLAGRSVDYAVTVKSVGKIEIPEANDEWAKSLDEGFETIADVRNKVRLDMETMAKVEADNGVRDELMNHLIDGNSVEVPPTLVNYQAQGLTRQFAAQMEERGMNMEQADEKLWQMLYQQMMPQAEREVRGALLLDEIAGIENIEVTDEETNAEIEAIARYSQRTPDEVREALKQQNGENSISDRLRNRKAIEILMATADITDGEWIDPQTAAANQAAEAEADGESESENLETASEEAAQTDTEASAATEN